jgi:hypothetical protein
MIENVNVDLLNKTYQNANLGITAIRAVLGKVSNEQMDSDLHKQLQDYRSLASRTKRQLQDNGECPKNISTYKRAMMKGNVRMNTMISRSDSHIAQMVIQGSTMGVTQMMRLIHSSESADQACKQIAEEFVKKEESNIEKMKTYL